MQVTEYGLRLGIASTKISNPYCICVGKEAKAIIATIANKFFDPLKHVKSLWSFISSK
jgi:hypothetical protein